MCDGHSPHESFPLRKMMLWVYTKWVNDTLDFYLFLGKMGRLPLIGRAIRFFAGQYGKYLHGGRVATVEECFEVIGQARRLTVVDCACRKKYQRCDKPLRTCIGIDTGAEVLGEIKHGEAISREQAGQIIKDAYDAGLIRSVTHCVTPNLYVICNCCTCCCVPYRLRSEYGVENAMGNGRQAAVMDINKCTKCDKCQKVCPGQAISTDTGIVDQDKCLGCGLCVGVCSHDALSMTLRNKPYREAAPGIAGNILMYTVFLLVILPIALGFKVLRR